MKRGYLKWTGAAVALPLIALGVQSAASHIVHWISPPTPSVPTQLAQTELALGTAGFRITFLQAVHFRGPGTTSYLMVVRNKSVDAEHYPGQSDQVRIYDLPPGGHHLRLSVLLKPITLPTDPSGRQAQVVDLAAVGNYDDSGFPDAIVSFASQTPGDALYPHPILVRWQPEHASYQTVALFPAPPSLPRVHASFYGSVARSIYLTPSLYRDVVSGGTVRAFGAGEEMAIQTIEGQPYIVHLYVLKAYYANRPETAQVVVSGLQEGSAPVAEDCVSKLLTDRSSPELTADSVALVLQTAWEKLRHRVNTMCQG